MPISNYHRIAFIHIPKNAGKSLETAFQIATSQDHRSRHQTRNVVARALRKVSYLFDHPSLRNAGFGSGAVNVALQHLTFIEMNYAFQIPNDYLWVSSIRNPYTRIDSLYRHHGIKNGEDSETFEQFVRRFLNGGGLTNLSHDAIAHRRLQVHFLEGLSGHLDPEIELMEYESLNQSFHSFCHKNSMDLELSWHEKQIGNYTSVERPFLHWNASILRQVNEYYRHDFEELGYQLLGLDQLKDIDHIVDSPSLRRTQQ